MPFSGFANYAHTSTSPPHPSWSPITPSPSSKRSRSLDLDAGSNRKEPTKRIRRAWEDLLESAPATTLPDGVLSELFVSSSYFEAMYGKVPGGTAAVEEGEAHSEFFGFDRYLKTSAGDDPGHTFVAQVDDLDALLYQPTSFAEHKAWEATQLAGQLAVPSDTFMNFQPDLTIEEIPLDMDLAYYPQEPDSAFDAQEPNFAFDSQTLPADTLNNVPWELEAPSSLQFLTPDAQLSGFVLRKVQEHPLPVWWEAFTAELDASSLNAPSSRRVLRSAPAVAVPLPPDVGKLATSRLFVAEDEAMD